MLSVSRGALTPTGGVLLTWWLAEGQGWGECPQFLGVLRKFLWVLHPRRALDQPSSPGETRRASQALHTSPSPFFSPSKGLWTRGVLGCHFSSGACNSPPAPSLLSEEGLICPQHV